MPRTWQVAVAGEPIERSIPWPATGNERVRFRISASARRVDAQNRSAVDTIVKQGRFMFAVALVDSGAEQLICARSWAAGSLHHPLGSKYLLLGIRFRNRPLRRRFEYRNQPKSAPVGISTGSWFPAVYAAGLGAQSRLTSRQRIDSYTGL
jgi:hypothetical protein